jgi:phenylacetate-CoA ligase
MGEMQERLSLRAANVLRLLLEARRAEKQGLATLERVRRARLAEMVTFARANSPYYRNLYNKLPSCIDDPTQLPVTSKTTLMSHFDDWVTDREVTIEKARTFVDNPDLIGVPFLGKYTLATTSGTTGTPGLFLLDHRNWAVATANTLGMLAGWLTTSEMVRILGRRGRTALVQATGGHFVGATTGAAILKGRLGKTVRLFPAQTPLPELVIQLNRFQPALFLGYASIVAQLASEQEAGRLAISPVLVGPGSEGLPVGEYERIARAFHAKVRINYVATECLFMAVGCKHHWLHVANGWTMLEPVDADYRPVPPGQQSHTVLVSNLANRVQPILRYDLGDSVLQRPDRCACGNPLPAIRVQGRTPDLLTFTAEHAQPVEIAPLVFEAVVDRIAGVEMFQIVQTTPTNLRVRLRARAGTDPDYVWQAVHTAVVNVLTEHKIGHVTVERAQEPPEQIPGRKYRTVVPLR